jgi:hypothetical protein
MRVWATSFFVLFGLIEIIQWAQGLQVPFAAYVMIGALLAIASNADKWTPLLPKSTAPSPTASAPSVDSPSLDEHPALISMPTSTPTTEPRRYYPGAQLPELDPNVPPTTSYKISTSKLSVDDLKTR